MSTKNNLIIGLRWLCFLPAAILCATIVNAIVFNAIKAYDWFLGVFGHAVRGGAESLDFFSRVFYEGIGSLAVGVTFVMIGCAVAPLTSKSIVYLMLMVGAAFSGIFLYLAIGQGDSWTIFHNVGMMVGTAVGAHFAAQELGGKVQ